MCIINTSGMKSINLQNKKDKYLYLSNLGSDLNLSFSSHLQLNNKLIALDGTKRKLLVFEFGNDLPEYYIIELDRVQFISVKKQYHGIKAGALNKQGLEQFIKSIHLYFEHTNSKDNVAVPFYDTETNEAPGLPKLDSVARNWQKLLSKLIGVRNKHLTEDNSAVTLQP